MKTPTKTKNNDANLCRLKGWKVGDIIEKKSDVVGRSGKSWVMHWGYYAITAIGEAAILVRQLPAARLKAEARWVYQNRTHVLAKVDQLPPHCPGCSPREKNNPGATHCYGTIEHPEVKSWP